MPQNRPCNVAWCDHDCGWEYETDGLPPVLSGDDLLARARYLTGFGHPPFRWHSRLWPSGLCVEQNEFLPDADPRYVAEHGRLTISGAIRPVQLAPEAGETQPGPHRPDGRVEAQLAADLAEAAALTTVAPGHIEPGPPPGAP